MALTPQQLAALDELFRAAAVAAAPPAAPPEDLMTWLGISKDDLKAGLQTFLAAKTQLQTQALDWINANPLDANLQLIGLASWAFYQAEKDVNPKIKTFMDAFYYISTCASVGYADIFALTQRGRAIASLVMLIGPSLTQKALEYPKR